MSTPVRHRILLVEDEYVSRMVSAAVLADAGYEVVEASDGLEAWQALSLQRPDLIVCDVRMPRCTGLELLRKVRADPALAGIPFVIASAADKTADHRSGMSLGADDYLVKPFEPAELLKSVSFRLARLSGAAAQKQNAHYNLVLNMPREVRGPLVGVLGYAELILNAAESDTPLSRDQLFEYGQGIRRAGWRLLETSKDFALISELNQISDPHARATSARSEAEAVDGSLTDRHLRRYASEFGRVEDLKIEVESAAVLVPQIGLHRVWQHLVANALKYSVRGQPVRITGRIHEQQYRFSVTDLGRGMTPLQIAELLGPSIRDRRSPENGGPGMGLSLARRFAELGHGQFTLEPNNPGPGITATLILPLHVDSSPGEFSSPDLATLARG